MRYSTTWPLKFIFPSVVLTGPPESIYLTFDDGPHPAVTPGLLDFLKERNVAATFFLVGKNVEFHPELALRIAREGHTIGNHGFDHSTMLFRSSKHITDQILRTEEVIRQTTGVVTRLLRPPFGYFGPTLYWTVKRMNYKLTIWDIDPGDFEKVSADTIVRRVTKRIRPGSIILLHDNSHTQGRIVEILRKLLDSRAFGQLPFRPLVA